jgi:hypothetical protein
VEFGVFRGFNFGFRVQPGKETGNQEIHYRESPFNYW